MTNNANYKVVKNKHYQKLSSGVNRSIHLDNAQKSHRSYPSTSNQRSNFYSNSSSKSINKTNLILCNYCCKQGHTSVDCWFMRKNNISNVVWMSKSRNK